MVTVAQAEKLILSTVRGFGTEMIPFDRAQNRVLAQDLRADRDFPPFNRVTMDGMAISFRDWQSGIRTFTIKGTQAAGDQPIEIGQPGDAVEIMTGAALPLSTDTVVSYEELDWQPPIATIKKEITQGQSIHFRGRDKQKGDVLALANQWIAPAIIGLAAATGTTMLQVKKCPRVAIISTGDELVAPDEEPTATQVRRSNDITIASILKPYGIDAALLHVADDPQTIKTALAKALEDFDVLLLSGGVSMGKFDYIPQVLEELGVQKSFHRVQQRPGKPFWFGQHGNGATIFAFPGNPVSTFMCLLRYFLPWLRACLGLEERRMYALLDEDFSFEPRLQYFLQVRLTVSEQGQWKAILVTGNGSGDFVNLVMADAFMELPVEENNFMKGSAYPVWPFAAHTQL